MPPEGKLEASGSPLISSLPLNSAMAPPSSVGARKESCFSAVRPVIGWNQWVKWVAPCSMAQSFMAAATTSATDGVQRRTLLDGLAERLVDVFRKPRPHHVVGEDVAPEELSDRGRRLGGAPSLGRPEVMALMAASLARTWSMEWLLDSKDE